jgi:CBS domain-containing protein
MTDRLTVADAMHRGVVTCEPETALSKVAQMMVGHRIHCVVVNARDEPSPAFWSVVSDLDLVASVAHERDEETPAGQVAATPALQVGLREPLRRAGQLMMEHATTHLIVVERGRPVGVISTLDLARVLADDAGA